MHFRKLSKGNVVNWDMSIWKLTNVAEVYLNKETVCNLPEPRHVLFPTKRSYQDHKLLCTTLNGKVTNVNSSEFQELLIEEFKQKTPSQMDIARVK